MLKASWFFESEALKNRENGVFTTRTMKTICLSA